MPPSVPSRTPFLLAAGLVLICACAVNRGSVLPGAVHSCVAASAAPADRAGDPVRVVFTVTVPADTPPPVEVYLAGDFQGWNPGDPEFRLVRSADGLWRIALDLDPGGTVAFKFTRGYWGVVEKGPQGQEIPNRTLSVRAAGEHRFTVASWAQGPPPAPLSGTRTGHVETITVEGFLGGRRVWIYLPPGYADDPAVHFPVLYMLDGQNLFDAATSFVGEWEVDETCEREIAAGRIAPLVVVGVDNGSRDRVREYTPWADSTRSEGGGADEHLQAVVTILLPAVAARYRVLTGPAHTGLAGSSLGGLFALYGGMARPDVFGLVAAFSPSLGWAQHRLYDWTASRTLSLMASRTAHPLRIYMDMGEWESGHPRDGDGNGIPDPFDALRIQQRILVELGFQEGRDLLVVEEMGAPHHESAWARRLPAALEFLFPPAKDGPPR